MDDIGDLLGQLFRRGDAGVVHWLRGGSAGALLGHDHRLYRQQSAGGGHPLEGGLSCCRHSDRRGGGGGAGAGTGEPAAAAQSGAGGLGGRVPCHLAAGSQPAQLCADAGRLYRRDHRLSRRRSARDDFRYRQRPRHRDHPWHPVRHADPQPVLPAPDRWRAVRPASVVAERCRALAGRLPCHRPRSAARSLDHH